MDKTNEPSFHTATINWYPGHMEKARREMKEALKDIDLVVELRDARLPRSSGNPLLKEMAGDKPRLIILTKKDRADVQQTEKWMKALSFEGEVVALDILKDPVKKIAVAKIEEMLKEKRERALRRGIRNKSLRVMVVGIPNVGKSTFINHISGKKSLKAENRPGVTRSLAQIRLTDGITLMDTPGVLWPKFDDQQIGIRLALIGSIGHNAIHKIELTKEGLHYLIQEYPNLLKEKYGCEENDDEKAFECIARHRQWLKSDNQVDEERTANCLLSEFQNDLCVTWEKCPE